MSLRSGSIRQSISTSKRFLSERLQRATDLINADMPANADDCQDAIDNLTEVQQLLEASIHNIEKKDAEWQTLIQKTDDEDAVQAEQVQYDLTAAADTTGYLIALNETQSTIGRISTRLRRLNRTLATFHGHATLSGGGRESVSGSHLQLHTPNSNAMSRVKTPKIVLPIFEGDILKWKEFWSIFSNTIHNRSDMSGVEKFSYLLPQLKGRAKQSIEGLLIADDNYDTAIDILKHQFDRSDDLIISMLYGELKQLPRSSARRDDKRRTFDACERMFRQLELAGEDIDSNRALTIDLLSKFPWVRDLQRHYSIGVHSKLSDVRCGIDDSISELETTSGILDDLDAINNASVKPKHANANGRRQNGYSTNTYKDTINEPREDRNSAFSTVTVADSARRSYRPNSTTGPSSNCYFCDGSHFNGDCTKYPTAKSREQRLYDLKRCIKCGRNHNSGGKRNQCNNPQVKCVHCKTKNDHYSALCRIQYPSKTDNQSRPGQPKSAKQPKDAASASEGSTDQHGKSFVAVGQAADITILNNIKSNSALFQTAKVQICNAETGEKTTLRLCLDSLSNRSYITDKAADLLNLSSCGFDRLLVSVFGSQKCIEVPTRMVKFGVVEADGSIRNIEANTTKIISNSGVLPGTWPDNEIKLLQSMKRSHTLADDPFDDDKSVDVLIGADYVWEFITGGKITTATGIYFIPSTLGLMLAGQLKYDDPRDNDRTSTMLCITETSRQFELGMLTSAYETKIQPNYPDIDEYWNLESIGITDCPIENEDEKALDTFRETVYYNDGRYHVTWPWIKEKRCLLPSNYDVALRRFKSLSTRLKLNKDLLQGYRDVVETQLDLGIIERVPLDQIDTTNTTHYLPHHPVIKSSSATTKIRIVYDASSKLRKNDVCLNECLLRGPVILPDMCQLLMRFRIHQIAVVSDIEKAFLQVALQPSERDVTRFIWYDDDKKPDIITDNLAVYRFCRVAFGVISSPFLLGATIQHHLAAQNTKFATALLNDIYVDNVISGVDDESELSNYYHNVKSIFNNAGMNLQEFCSNSKTLMDYIPQRDRVKNMDVKVLGMKWDSQSDDTIRVTNSPKWRLNSGAPTKRSVLQTIASVFDPLGLFQPVLFQAKLFLQNLWKSEIHWDAALNDVLTEEWNSIVKLIEGIFDFRVPRYIGNAEGTSTIIVFSDASAKGYGVAVYLRCRNGQGNGWISNLLFAKSRLAPMSKSTKSRENSTCQVTLPRLELLGATIAATAAEFCRNALGIRQLKIHFFIDSECVLQWIRSKNVLKRFVARRVDKIRSVERCVFHYVETAHNPADYLTRGKSASELSHDRQWWHGPHWLTNDESDWPETRLEDISDVVLREIAAETKPTDICHAATNVQTNEVPETQTKGFIGIDPDEVSSLRRLLRITAICLKFMRIQIWNRLSHEFQKNCKLKPIFDRLSDDTTITAPDIEFATESWIRHVQSRDFGDLNAIGKGPKRAIISQLGLRIGDDGMIHSCSRFANADLPDTSKYPLLLPKNNRFTELIVTDVHNRLRHSGVSHTLSEVRKRYWIPQGRSFVKKILKRCVVCRLFKTAVPFALPNMPPWPLERVTRSVPFQFTGLDYFGPIKVRINDTVHKMWACLFTCLATRAVHLEGVSDCTSVEFLNSLIRFISRRGCPEKITSDNAAQFHLVKILGDRAWNSVPIDESLLSYSAHSGIQWKFIIELAPWQGGHYERLVGVVKSVLKTAVGRRLLTWTDFITLLTETEAIVNSRPITYVSEDVGSQMRALRPIDFLVNQPTSTGANEDDFPTRDLGDSGKRLAAIWKQRKRHLNKLWHHWYDEYLLSLRERGKSVHRNGRGHLTRSPREGEVVLLHDKNLPRGSWRLAKITQLIPSGDGNVRAAEIKLSNGVQLRRAVNHLIPLEVDNEFDSVNGEVVTRHLDQSDNSLTSDNDNDDADFFGFSHEEVQRTVDAVQRMQNSNDPSNRTSEHDQ